MTNKILVKLICDILEDNSLRLYNRVCNDWECEFSQELWDFLNAYQSDPDACDQPPILFKVNKDKKSIIGYDWAVPLACKWHLEKQYTNGKNYQRENSTIFEEDGA